MDGGLGSGVRGNSYRLDAFLIEKNHGESYKVFMTVHYLLGGYKLVKEMLHIELKYKITTK